MNRVEYGVRSKVTGIAQPCSRDQAVALYRPNDPYVEIVQRTVSPWMPVRAVPRNPKSTEVAP